MTDEDTAPIDPSVPPQPAADAASAVPDGRVRRAPVHWWRFWLQMLAAMVAFNIIAGVVTWFFIFPRLHPGQ